MGAESKGLHATLPLAGREPIVTRETSNQVLLRQVIRQVTWREQSEQAVRTLPRPGQPQRAIWGRMNTVMSQ